MHKIWGYLDLHHPAARETLDPKVVVSASPSIGAFLDAGPKLIDLETGQQRNARDEISVDIGTVVFLSCLKPVLSFVGREVLAVQDSPIPTELLVVIAYVHEALRSEAYPPAFVSSLRGDPALEATLTFLLAHETSHHVFNVDRTAARHYGQTAGAVLDQLLSEPDFFSVQQISWTTRLFQNPALHASWIEELAADMMAYDICLSVCDQNGRRDLMGVTTLIVMAVILEHYMELEGIPLTPSHPYAAAGLLAFEKHRQNILGLPTPAFKETLDWLIPTRYFDSLARILRSITR
jgi:hypothetical protein